MKKLEIELTSINIEIIANAHCYFNNTIKAALWFRIKNPKLNDLTPIEMMRFGQSKKLLRIIIAAIDDGEKAPMKIKN